MGTHPIFESDFDCLTDGCGCRDDLGGRRKFVSANRVLRDRALHRHVDRWQSVRFVPSTRGTLYVSTGTRERYQPIKIKKRKDFETSVIRGWDEGISQMTVGQRAKLICTDDYGYGDSGYPGVIPPKATLMFDIKLIDFKSKTHHH